MSRMKTAEEIISKVKKSKNYQNIEKTLSKIDGKLTQNPHYVIPDTDLDNLRAFVVQHSEPIQAIKLLMKQREEREVEEEYHTKLENIVQNAEEIEQKTDQYVHEQQKMMTKIDSESNQLKKAANRRKQKKTDKKVEIENLKSKTLELQNKENELKKLQDKEKIIDRGIKKFKGYEKFLDNVLKIADESEGKKDIDTLINRFRTLTQSLARTKASNEKIEAEIFRTKNEQEVIRLTLETEILELNTQVDKRQQEIEKIDRNLFNQKSELEKTLMQKSSEHSKLVKLLNSINFLYYRLIKVIQTQASAKIEEKLTPIEEENKKDYMRKLEIIKNKIIDLKALSEKISSFKIEEYYSEALKHEHKNITKDTSLAQKTGMPLSNPTTKDYKESNSKNNPTTKINLSKSRQTSTSIK